MKELHIFYAPDLPTDLALPDDEAAHALRVLRMKEGDKLIATDGRGTFYDCTIASATSKRATLRIDSEKRGEKFWNGRIHLAVAPTKNMDRMEWLAEKATEIGFDILTFLDCQFSERRVVKTERIERIVVAATKQSHKAWKPEVEEMTKFAHFIERKFNGQKFIAHCYDMEEIDGSSESSASKTDEEATRAASPFLLDVAKNEGDAVVLIGPEGDFSIDEVKAAIAAGFQPISLGRSRLRTETAALAAVHILNIAKHGKVTPTL